MALKYVLTDNQLTPAADDYTAQVHQVKSNSMEDILREMEQSRTGISLGDMKSVLDNFKTVLSKITARGESINTDIIKTNLTISGIFMGPTDSFDPKRHTVHVNVTAGKVLKDAINQVKTEKQINTGTLPIMLEVKDSVSGSINSVLTPNGVLEISGNRLKIEGDPDQTGVFFINQEDETVHTVVTFVENKPGRLIIVIPALPQGNYELQLKTQYSGSSVPLKQVRSSKFSKTLEVLT